MSHIYIRAEASEIFKNVAMDHDLIFLRRLRCKLS